MTLPVDIQRLALELVDEIDAILRPLVHASRHPATLRRLAHQAGWDLDALLAVDPDALAASVDALVRDVRALAVRILDADDIAALGPTVRTLVETLRDLVDALDGDAVLAGLLTGEADAAHRRMLLSALAADLADHLLLRWLQERAPVLLDLGRLVGVIASTRAPALYLAAAPAPGAEPVRLPIKRARLQWDALRSSFLVPVAAFAGELPYGSHDSPTAFVAGVQHVLERRMRDLVAGLLRHDFGVVTVRAGSAGLELHAPALLPTALLSSWPELAATDRVTVPLAGGGAPLPAVDLGREAWRLRWPDTDDPAPVPVVDGLLEIRPGLSRPTARGEPGPGVALSLDTSEAAKAQLSIVVALGLTLGDSIVEVAATLEATSAAGEIGVGVELEGIGPARVPVLLPGLDGTALVVEDPRLVLDVAGIGGDLRLDVQLGARAFGLDLPAALVRPVHRAEPSAPWELAAGAARVSFTLEDPDGAPVDVLDLGIAIEDGQVIVDRLAFPGDAPLRLVVDIDPLLIGADPGQGLVVEVDAFVLETTPGGTLGPIGIAAARLHLPTALPGLPAGIELTDVTIADGAVSGRAAVVFPEPAAGAEPPLLFGVLPLDLRSVAVALEDNLPVEFDLRARVKLPWFEEWVDVEIGLDDDFDLVFRVESTDPEGITLTKQELLELTFSSAGFTHTGATQTLELALSGGIRPLLWGADGLEWPRLDVTELVIEQDLGALAAGRLEPPRLRFAEAWLDLRELATLDLFGFHFELSRIGIGYLEDSDELWIDLSGSLRLIELIPVGLGVEGFRVVWPRRIYEELGLGGGPLTVEDVVALASRIQVRFDGIELLFGIPGAAEFEGLIRFVKDADSVGFAGDVALRVPAIGLAVEAGLLVGMTFPPAPDAPFPFLYVHFGVVLPAGIPLAQSGLALKGARGLFGLNVEPDREPDQNPYYDWYKRGPVEGAHPTTKWRDRVGSIAFGAGVTITTVDGKLVGVQGLLVVVIPGPVVMVEGKALLFDGVFPGDGPLKALGFFDGNELTAQLNVEASTELVAGLVDVAAGLEAFFDFRALHRWHLFLGQDQPPERRIHARFLDLPGIGWLFSAEAWLMLDMPDEDTLRSRLGVHIGFAPPPVELVVASVRLEATLDGEGLMTLNPFQFTGSVALQAVLEVEAFDLVSVGVEASAEVAIEGPLPLIVDARVAAQVDLPVPDLDEVPVVGEWAASALDWFEENVADLPDIPASLDIEVPLHWELDAPPELEPLVAEVTVESHWTRHGGPALRGADDAAALDAPVVPLDARPTVVFDQHVGVAAELPFGGFADTGIQRFRSGGLAFRPRVRRVRLWRLPLHAFDPDAGEQAWVLVGDTSSADDALALPGVFRPAASDENPAVASRRVLDLLTTDPFTFVAGTVPLAVPASSAEADLEPVASGPAVGGKAGLRWCDVRPAQDRCVDGDDLDAARRRDRPVAVAVEGGWALEQVVKGVRFRAGDLRLVPGDGGAALVAAASGGARLRIVFPERVMEARITVADAMPTGVTARRAGPARFGDARANGVGRRIEVQDPCAERAAVTVTAAGRTVTVRTSGEDAPGAGFDCLLVSGRGDVVVTRVCWTTADEIAGERERARACARNEGLAARAGEPGDVLSPGHLFKLEIKTSVELDEPACDWDTLALASLPGFDGAIAPYRVPGGREAVDTFHFRTQGPPDDLAPFVRWASATDRALHFADDDVVVRFARPHVHRMYPDADNGAPGPAGSPYALEAWIVDAEGHVLSDWFVNWTDAGSATLLPGERRWYRELAGVAPPSDDVVEIRRPLEIRGIAELGAADWLLDRLPAGSGRRSRWQHQPDGTMRLRPGGGGLDLALVARATGMDLRLDATVRPDTAAGAVGVVLLDDGQGNRYELRLHPRDGQAQLVRVAPDRRTTLAHTAIAPGARAVAMSVEAARDGIGLRLRARIDGVELSARDATPATSGGRAGLLGEGVGGLFGPIALGPPGRGLATDARYTVALTGGEGGPIQMRDDFRGTAFLPGVSAEGGWTRGNDGLAGSTGARLAYDAAVDDGDVTTVLRAAPGDRVVLTLRRPDARRAPGDAAAYELSVERTSEDARVVLRSVGGPAAALLGESEVLVGSASELTVRARLLGDRVRAWVFDRLALDIDLAAAGGVVRAGTLAWDVRAGTPALRTVEVRRAALLTIDLATSRYRTFTELARAAAAGPDLRTAIAQGELRNRLTALRATESLLAAARVAFDVEAAKHRIGGSDREAVEHRRQALVDAGAVHDGGMLELLLDFGAIDGADEPSIRAVRNPAGRVVAHVLRSPDSWEPRGPVSGDGLPHAATGRTAFRHLGAGDAQTAWVGTADGRTVLVWAAGPATGAIRQNAGATALRVTHVRDHADHARTDAGYDHLHDRPYRRSTDGRGPIEVDLALR